MGRKRPASVQSAWMCPRRRYRTARRPARVRWPICQRPSSSSAGVSSRASRRPSCSTHAPRCWRCSWRARPSRPSSRRPPPGLVAATVPARRASRSSWHRAALRPGSSPVRSAEPERTEQMTAAGPKNHPTPGRERVGATGIEPAPGLRRHASHRPERRAFSPERFRCDHHIVGETADAVRLVSARCGLARTGRAMSSVQLDRGCVAGRTLLISAGSAVWQVAGIGRWPAAFCRRSLPFEIPLHGRADPASSARGARSPTGLRGLRRGRRWLPLLFLRGLGTPIDDRGVVVESLLDGVSI